jgi:prepilin-type processing-associated H-X9-DG protein
MPGWWSWIGSRNFIFVDGHINFLKGGKIREACSFGPVCRVGGEVECAVIQGHSNKYHDGFLGHS